MATRKECPKGARIAVYDEGAVLWPEIRLTPEDWARVKDGRPLTIQAEQEYFDCGSGEYLPLTWRFAGGVDGRLEID